MKVQFITTAFNGMAQRLWIELNRLNHEVKVHIAFTADKMIEAVTNYGPDLIIAPFLTSKIPSEIYKNFTCLIVHSGIKGDRRASSLDWAILQNKKTWGILFCRQLLKWMQEIFGLPMNLKCELFLKVKFTEMKLHRQP